MEVKLQREATGQEIADAFKSAGNYTYRKFRKIRKWEGKRRTKIVNGEKKVTAYASKLHWTPVIKLGVLWIEQFRITLPYLDPAEKYDKVEITYKYHDIDKGLVASEDEREIANNMQIQRLINRFKEALCNDRKTVREI